MTFAINYQELKNSYEKFKTSLPKDPFNRYAQELNYARNLTRAAKLEGLEEDVFQYQKIEQESLEKLQALGYNIK